MPTLERLGDVFILNLGDDENRFNPPWIGAINDALDEVEAATGPKALVTKADGKFWSNGLDLAWIGEHQDEAQAFIDTVHALFARVLLFPGPTIAAIQGHCFAAGAMLSTAHDLKVMREDRGFWCTPEVDIHIPFTPGMAALLQARLSHTTAHEAMTMGRRYGGKDAVEFGIVDHAAKEKFVLDWAISRGEALAHKDGATMGRIKERMYGHVAAILRDPAANRLGA
ncbi:MAG: enoyl-CoA hydratase/isomerase family protein [Solirubrobacteraceae bacterium]|nr:enoyl-CoA hydratase/isomerase family protein [Solirubrobacteraceae bacterium]